MPFPTTNAHGLHVPAHDCGTWHGQGYAPLETAGQSLESISQAMDMDISYLVKDGKLAWMPAHQSLQMVGETKLSNGCRLTAIDWRANRLVDVLAKTAAADLQASKDTLALLSSAEAAADHRGHRRI